MLERGAASRFLADDYTDAQTSLYLQRENHSWKNKYSLIAQ
jgi:hypothetical protein